MSGVACGMSYVGCRFGRGIAWVDLTLICGDVELISLGVEDGCYSVDGPAVFCGGGVRCDYIEGVNRCNSDWLDDVHCLCDCN